MTLTDAGDFVVTEEGVCAPSPRWGFWPRILLIAVLIYCVNEVPLNNPAVWLLSALMHWPFLWIKSSHPFLAFGIGMILACVLINVAIIQMGLRLFGFSLQDIGLTRPRWKTLYQTVLALVLIGIYRYLYTYIEIILFHTHGHLPGKMWLTWWAHPLGPANSVYWSAHALYWAETAVLGTLTDQGLLYSALRKRLKPLAAIALTAALFTLYTQIFLNLTTSFGRSLFDSCYAFLLSAILCSLREWSGNTWAPVAAHLLANFSGFWTQWHWG